MSAGAALQAAALAALAAVEGLGRYELAPVQAALPYATIETGPESDWGHKSGAGRELRLAATLRDAGERPERLRRLMAAVEVALAGLERDLPGWRLVTMMFVRSRLVRERSGQWAGVVEFRARMLAE